MLVRSKEKREIHPPSEETDFDVDKFQHEVSYQTNHSFSCVSVDSLNLTSIILS